jgi:BA14K-like protein
MRKAMMAVLATAALSSSALIAAPAQAAPASDPISALRNGGLQTSYVQWRRGGYYGRPGYYGRGYYGRPGYYRRDRGYGGAAAAGALGLATGAIIGGAIAQQQQQAPVYVAPGGGSDAYCAQRYRSYDPASGTFLGYDGLRHPCP